MSTVLTCESCGGPLAYGAPSCAYCRAPQTWERLVSIERGSPFLSIDLAREPMTHPPKSASRQADGLLITTSVADWTSWHRFGPKLRNGCVAVTGKSLDPTGVFGLYARMHAEGEALAAYELMIYPRYRAWRLRRELWWPSKAYASVIVDWERAPAILGVGHDNEVELRFADSVFQIVCNGHRVSTLVDASFGFGMVGWIGGSVGGPARTLLRTASAWQAR